MTSVIAGVDEAGRGALAGPVMAAAVIFAANGRAIPEGIKDSKKLTPAVRERLATTIKEAALDWHVASATAKEVDQLNVLQATMVAMRRAVAGLSTKPTLVRIDGNKKPDLSLPTIAVVGGDQLFVEISAASILAKVTRDEYLIKLDQQHPGYGFASHKGYGTKAHLAALETLGPLPCHRQTFAPVSKILTLHQKQILQ